MHSKKKFITATLAVSIVYFFSTATGCVNHKADIVYPCDTALVRYSVEIRSIMDDQCQNCHGASPEQNANSFGINLYDYPTISAFALDDSTGCDEGVLLGSLTHSGCISEMPKGQDKLNDCSINKFRAWVNRGAPNN